MKKLLLFIPAGLIASAGLLWMGVDYYYGDEDSDTAVVKSVPSGQKLFNQSEESLRQIIRHGDINSIQALKTSLNSLSLKLTEYKSKNFSTDKIETYVSSYRTDTFYLSDKILSHAPSIAQYDQLTQTEEQPFNTSVEQVGLYELTTASKNLGKLFKEFTKNPSDETKQAYIAESEKIKTIIVELYLDASIEKPMLTYIEHHRNYFTAINDAYGEIGYERIKRLKTTAYAVQTELELLPSL